MIKSYILFFCLYDPFRKGLPVYTFTNTCHEDASVPFEDGAINIIFKDDYCAAEIDFMQQPIY